MANVGGTRYKLLSVADTAIALLVTFPLACMFWRGIWDLIGYYVLREREPLTLWVQTTISLLQMVGLMLLPLIGKYLNPSEKVKFWIFTRIFMYIHTIIYMFYWHGFWELLNFYIRVSWQYNLAQLLISQGCLILLGGCRSTMWPPFFIVIDKPDLFTCANRFGSQAKHGQILDFISDAFVAQIVVLGVAINCWRSIFNLMDVFIFPGETLKSNVTCIVAGFIGCTLLLCLQRPLGLVSIGLARRSAFLKLAWEDAVYCISFIALSLLWRGAWNLNAEYLIKELPLGGWVNHITGTVGLMAMQTFGEVSAFGMIRDGTDPGGEAFYPVHYLRYFLKGWYTEGDSAEIQQKEHEHRGRTNIAFVGAAAMSLESTPADWYNKKVYNKYPAGSQNEVFFAAAEGVSYQL